MDVLIFIVVLIVLILVHEAGHFFVAKMVGMRVDEFGLGYPPRLWGIKFGETEYTINALPFGGFVRIYGEDDVGKTKAEHTAKASGAFVSKPRLAQALVLFAGVTMNMILAWVLITGALVIGTPRGLAPAEVSQAHNVSLIVGQVLSNSPASKAGFLPGDIITTAQDGSRSWSGANTKAFTTFVAEDVGVPMHISITRNNKSLTLTATPAKGVVSSDPSRYALGVGISTIGILPLSLTAAISAGTVLTWEITRATAVGLAHFLAQAVTLSANLSQIAGPIGIASAVGAAATHGMSSLFALVAVISINLAIINLIPIPALDGGRLFFVLIEAVTRRSIKPRIAQAINVVGFALIIILMVVVTVHDIYHIIG